MTSTKRTLGLTALFALAPASNAFAIDAPPSRGAPIFDVVVGTGVAVLLALVAGVVGYLHRTGRISIMDYAGAAAARRTGLPAWAAIPMVAVAVSLGLGGAGFVWDVATHLDSGRDPGPFSNPAHYPILAGLGGLIAAGWFSVVIGSRTPFPGAVRLGRAWYAPTGGLVMLLCGAFAAAGFPLDDAWHRLFGQDVTLWGPTHLMMVGGASVALIGVWMLVVEAWRQRPEPGTPKTRGAGIIQAVLGGALLLGLSSLQLEFNFGIPQFQLLFHPILLALAASIGLVVARMRMGPGGALKAAGVYVVAFGVMAVAGGPLLGHTLMRFPLYLVEAALVELVALRMIAARPLTFGAAAGAAVGTLGFAFEWAWSHIFMPIPWSTAMLPAAPVLALVAGVAGGMLGAAVGNALADPGRGQPIGSRWLVAAAGLAVVACIAYPTPRSGFAGGSATVDLLPSGQAHRVFVRARLHPNGLARGAEWFTATYWQGGGTGAARMREVTPGVYRSSRPVPIGASWKTMLRLERGSRLGSVPISLPADPAIPVGAVAAMSHSTRSFEPDKKVLQREAVGGSLWLVRAGYFIVLVMVVIWFVGIIAGLMRVDASRRALDEGIPVHQPAPLRAIGRWRAARAT